MMLKHFFYILFIYFLCPIALSQDTLFSTLYFHVDKYSVSSSEQQKLDELLTKTSVLQEIYLTGHTDSDGSNEYNKALSQRRVEMVNEYFSGKVNVPIHKDYYGEEKPVSANTTDEGKKTNRRVEVALIYTKSLRGKHLTLQDVYDELAVSTQRFRIPTKRDTILVLQKGTVIAIKANTFHTPTNYAYVEFKEAYTYAEMIGERLSTTSNGRLLETGGMVKLNYQNEEGEDIQPQQNVNVFMPATELKEDMELFFGERDPHDLLNWQLNDGSTGGRGAVYFPSSLINSGDFNSGEFNGRLSDENCKFFFCKIRRGFRKVGGVFFKGLREKEKETFDGAFNDSIQNLMDSLGVNNYYELQKVLRDQKVERGEGTAADVGYYGFSTAYVGWINCDRFRNFNPLIVMNTPLKVNEERFMTLVFKDDKSLFPAGRVGTKYAFLRVPEGIPVYYVVIETKKDKVLLSIVNTKISANAPEVEFEEIELSSLKGRLLKLK